MSEKYCGKCGKTKPLDEFHRAKKGKLGRQAHCKECVSAYAAEWRKRNDVKGKQRRRQDNPEVSEITCTKCHKTKPLDDFYKSLHGSHGRESRCKECRRAGMRARSKEYEATPARKASNRKRNRKTTLKQFGLTPEAYNVMFAQQNGRCAICGTDQPGGKHKDKFHVDHDHATGNVRGLLCANCNVGLGKFGDDPARIRAAIAYLAKHGITPH